MIIIGVDYHPSFRIFRVDRCGQRFHSGPVNPNFAGTNRWSGSASYKALRMKLVGNIEHFLALPKNVFRLAIVHHRRLGKPRPE
jgi:hypothetical protein